MQERRKNNRHRTYLGGRISFNRHCSTMDCLVRNLSPDGAKVTFVNTVLVPKEFDLTITQRAQTLRARMIWRQCGEAGVVFLEPRPETAPIPLDLARRVKECETEREALRRRLEQRSTPI